MVREEQDVVITEHRVVWSQPEPETSLVAEPSPVESVNGVTKVEQD